MVHDIGEDDGAERSISERHLLRIDQGCTEGQSKTSEVIRPGIKRSQ